MKKNIMKVAFVATFALIAGYGMSNSQKTEVMSDIMVANMEALADFSRGVDIPCIEGGERCNFKFNDASGKEHDGYINGMKNPE